MMYFENYVHVYMVMLVIKIVLKQKYIFTTGESWWGCKLCVAEVHIFEHVGGQLERKL